METTATKYLEIYKNFTRDLCRHRAGLFLPLPFFSTISYRCCGMYQAFWQECKAAYERFTP